MQDRIPALIVWRSARHRQAAESLTGRVSEAAASDGAFLFPGGSADGGGES